MSTTKTELMYRITFTALFSCLIASCGGGGSSGDSNSSNSLVNIQTTVPVEQQTPRAFAVAEPYIGGTNYSDVLKTCYQATAETACTFSQLSMLGQVSDDIQVSEIMERVIVTHDWMGVRFEQFLSALPTEALPLFKPVAVIFIGSEVDFTTYNTNQAKLSITPKTLWVSENEKAAIAAVVGNNSGSGDSDDDFDTRSELQFSNLWTYNKSGFNLNTDDESDDRSTDRLFDIFAIDLYSSLAFAGNRFPGSVYTLNRPLATPSIIDDESDTVISGALYASTNLTVQDSILHGVSEVYFEDLLATDFEKTLTAGDIGAQFDLEGKMRLYSYTFFSRDTRNLFVAGMMKYKHDITVDTAFVEGIGLFSDSPIAYGMRNRIAAPLVAARVQFVMENYLGRSDELDDFFENGMGEFEYIEPGTTVDEYFDSTRPMTASNTWVLEQLINYNDNEQGF